MRYLVGSKDGLQSVFAVSGNSACNLTALDPAFGDDIANLIAMPNPSTLAEKLIQSAPKVDLASITPTIPLSRPGKILCLGLNYVDHVKEGGYDIPTYPALFMRATTSMIAAEAPMIRPTCSERLDYEAELMVVIGKHCRHVDEANALQHIFGYTVFNDGSVRDYQRKTHQWTPGKNFDGTGPYGPIIVTPDELPPGAAGLKIESRINGEVMQSASTSDMMWPVAKTIATLSEFTSLEPGDLVAMGTPPGVGHARKPPRWLVAGDVVEIEVEGICICRNHVIDETPVNNEYAA